MFNHRQEPAEVELRLEAAADFADLFEVKDRSRRKATRTARYEATSSCSDTGATGSSARATGTPFLLLRTLLGLEPDGDELTVDPALPDGIGSISLRGIPGRWGRADALATREEVQA